MNLEITPYTAPGRPPRVNLPDPKFLEYLGEDGVRSLINDHYDLMRKSNINHLFPKDDKGFEFAKEKAADFIIQICEGTPHYNNKHGNPFLKKRHMPFHIDAEARETWLSCYREALQKKDIPDNLLKTFWEYIDQFSIWIVNK